jgi:hypothetical protein
MKVNKHTTSDGKSIKTYDDLYDYAHRVQVLKFLLKGNNYTFDFANDTVLAEQNGHLVLRATVDPNEAMYKDMMRWNDDELSDIREEVGDRKLLRSWINVMNTEHAPNFHPDNFTETSKTVLYYANLKWDPSWDGFTVWRSADMKDIEYVSDYVPGRVSVFDSLIPHKACAQNKFAAGTWRFTLNSVWDFK